MDGKAMPENKTSAAPEPASEETPKTDVIPEVASKISDAHNILVALSSDPSVDEMAAAIGLSLYLDKLGKRATAIYSGSTPNALEFLKPEETFESTADTLQDFVIALNKDKADHLRYKLDGDFVKIFITPYRTRISEEDLDFSYGDFNVDLVLALDVANGIDLDSALREHGRIMHDAVIINITTGNPGKFGEIEWSDKKASSVSEMIAKLLYSVNSKAKIEKEEATAFLTGIVAATNRFSKANTTPDTMKIASRLMESGANQQLVSKNITPDIENEMFSMPGVSASAKKTDNTKLDIRHGHEEGIDESKEVDTDVNEKESSLLDDLKAAEASLAQAGAEATPEASNSPLKIDSTESSEAPDLTNILPTVEPTAEPVTEPATESTPELATETSTESTEPATETTSELDNNLTQPEQSITEGITAEPSTTDSSTTTEPTIESSSVAPEPTTSPELPSVTDASTPSPATEGFISDKPEKVIQPSSDLSLESPDGPSKYGKMLEEALASLSPTPTAPAPTPVPEPAFTSPEVAAPAVDANPAAMSAPAVPAAPEINGVPEINYMPMPGEEVLPPPPTPPIMPDVADAMPPMPSVEPVSTPAPIAEPAPVQSTMPEVTAPEATATPEVAAQPSATDPAAFKIPGM